MAKQKRGLKNAHKSLVKIPSAQIPLPKMVLSWWKKKNAELSKQKNAFQRNRELRGLKVMPKLRDDKKATCAQVVISVAVT